MDKDFLSQIDRVAELLGEPKVLLDDDVLICECFCVNVADIREACKDLQEFDLKTMQDNYSMGLGCQSCLKRIDSWVHKIF